MMSNDAVVNNKKSEAAWYCLRSKIKQERVAEQCLVRRAGIEAFAPRIKFRRRTRRGAVWFVDALFPGYLFARFRLADQHRLALSTIGVAGMVRFGNHVPRLPDCVIGGLRAVMSQEGVALIEDRYQSGDTVNIAGGPFIGLTGLVKEYVPPSGRVRILLEFMGRLLEVNVHESAVTPLKPRYIGPALISVSS